jgi:hypothetical protein
VAVNIVILRHTLGGSMRPHTTIAALALVTVAAASYAQTTDSLPPLTRNTQIQAGDSPMVRAAKAAVAARLRGPSQARTLINDQTLRRGRVFQPSGEALPAPNLGGYEASAGLATGSGASVEQAAQRAQVVQQIENLRTEQQVLADESDQEPYSDVDPDFAEQRLTQIPGQINAAEQQLRNPNPPPPPPGNN